MPEIEKHLDISLRLENIIIKIPEVEKQLEKLYKTSKK